MLLPLRIALVLLPLCAPLASAPGGPGGQGLPPAEPEAVDLEALRACPSRFVGRRVVLRVQRGEAGNEPQPALETGFDPQVWQRFACWSSEQRPWRAQDFADPAPYLFARRGSAAELLLSSAGPHRAFELVGQVRAVRLGEPWIAVEAARPLPESIGAGAVLHASRGFELLAIGQRRLALAELERALAAPLPERPRAELEAAIEALREDLRVRPESGPPAPRPGFEGELWRLELVSPRLPRGAR
jgi:hypothetical protein